MENGNNSSGQMQLLLGPHRVFPGRLSVNNSLYLISYELGL